VAGDVNDMLQLDVEPSQWAATTRSTRSTRSTTTMDGSADRVVIGMRVASSSYSHLVRMCME
jgi:hypothetical protein